MVVDTVKCTRYINHLNKVIPKVLICKEKLQSIRTLTELCILFYNYNVFL